MGLRNLFAKFGICQPEFVPTLQEHDFSYKLAAARGLVGVTKQQVEQFSREFSGDASLPNQRSPLPPTL